MNLKDRVYVKPDKQVRLKKVREIAVIIENRIKNSKYTNRYKEKQERQLEIKLVFPKLGKQNTILLSESTSNCNT